MINLDVIIERDDTKILVCGIDTYGSQDPKKCFNKIAAAWPSQKSHTKNSFKSPILKGFFAMTRPKIDQKSKNWIFLELSHQDASDDVH